MVIVAKPFDEQLQNHSEPSPWLPSEGLATQKKSRCAFSTSLPQQPLHKNLMYSNQKFCDIDPTGVLFSYLNWWNLSVVGSMDPWRSPTSASAPAVHGQGAHRCPRSAEAVHKCPAKRWSPQFLLEVLRDYRCKCSVFVRAVRDRD